MYDHYFGMLRRMKPGYPALVELATTDDRMDLELRWKGIRVGVILSTPRHHVKRAWKPLISSTSAATSANSYRSSNTNLSDSAKCREDCLRW